jgi:hypothetical protein
LAQVAAVPLSVAVVEAVLAPSFCSPWRVLSARDPEEGVGIEIDASCFSEFSISLTASAGPTLRADPLQLALTT